MVVSLTAPAQVIVCVEGVPLLTIDDQGARPVPRMLFDSRQRPAVKTENLLQMILSDPLCQLANLKLKDFELLLLSSWGWSWRAPIILPMMVAPPS